jgi:fucose 4-O-acetylase-like acetyltransferase
MDSTVSNGGKRRIQFIDLAKGICIIMVVLFHAGVLTPETPLLSNIRMPLYFFLSGLFFKTYGGTSNFVVKKVNKILVPFLFFYVIAEVVCVMRLVMLHGYGFTGVVEHICRFDLTCNIPLWFLMCLFVTNVIFCVLRRLLKNDVAFSLAVVACALLGVWYGENGVSGVAFSASALTALPFFYFGYMSNKTSWLYPGKYDRYNLPVAVLLIGAALALVYFSGNAHISMRDNRFIGSAAAAYFTSILAVSGILMLCKSIKSVAGVSYIGRYSIVVLGVHMIVMPLILFCLNHTNINGIMRSWIAGLGTIAVCMPLIPFFIKYAPRFTAQKDIFGTRSVEVLNKLRFAAHPLTMLRGLLHKHSSI